jgi:predicted nucleic acid-binding Zn ribbon protein
MIPKTEQVCPDCEDHMEREPNEQQRSRENTLAVSLVIVIGGIILFYLYLISLGIVGNVLAGGVLFVMIAILHYFVWGRSFSDEVATERQAWQRQQALEEESPRPRPVNPDAIQDLSRTQGIQKK